jgi:hypothetical protein
MCSMAKTHTQARHTYVLTTTCTCTYVDQTRPQNLSENMFAIVSGSMKKAPQALSGLVGYCFRSMS